MKNIIKTTLLFLTTGTLLFAQQNGEVPLDPSVKTGTLKNGMKYFIKHNEEPRERVSFYFAQNVGSVLEEDSQQGLAHFLEHMAFNGTEHFKDKEMLDYLQKNGIKFGSEINAFTSWDRTVYNINKVPTGNEKLLDSVLLILHDWSGYLSLTDEEIDNERGVVNEEWRTRNTPSQRTGEKIFTEGIVKGSVYENRMPIGLMSVINNFKYDELRDYYKKWYRPDQQAVIVVGDVDVDTMEKMIINRFSDIPLREGLPERKKFDVPLSGDFKFIEALDKEIGDVTLHYYIKDKVDNLNGTAEIDQSVILGLISRVFNGRLSELVSNEDCPAFSVKYAFTNQVRALDALSLTIKPKQHKILEAFEYSLTELARFAKYGATEGELERAKLSMKNSYISSLKNIDKISSDAYAKKLYEHFLEKELFPDISWYGNYIIKKLDEISNEDLIRVINSKYKYEDIMLGVMGTDEAKYPSEEEFYSIITKVKNASLDKFEDTFTDKPLISEKLKGSKVKSTFGVKGTDAKGYVLENGARIILYPTSYDNDKITLQAFSDGGESLIDDALLPSVRLTTPVVSESGLGDFDRIGLIKKLAGTNTSLYYLLDSYKEMFTGKSSKTDIEVLLKRLYLSFESPRFDEKAYELQMDRSRQSVRNKAKSIKSGFYDSLWLASVNYNKRVNIFNEDLLNKVSFNDIQTIYKQRFRNAADFTFVFVGDIDTDEMLALCEKYIGSISSELAPEKVIDRHLEPAKGKTILHMQRKMETPQSTVQITFEGKAEATQKDFLTINMIGQLLNTRYRLVIREQEGGSYGVSSYGWMKNDPKSKYFLQVAFDCNPAMTDRLVAVVYEEINKLSSNIKDSDLVEIKESLIKKQKEAVETNSYWTKSITDHLNYGYEIMPLDEYIRLVNSITKEDLKKAVKNLAENSDIVEGVLSPEE